MGCLLLASSTSFKTSHGKSALGSGLQVSAWRQAVRCLVGWGVCPGLAVCTHARGQEKPRGGTCPLPSPGPSAATVGHPVLAFSPLAGTVLLPGELSDEAQGLGRDPQETLQCRLDPVGGAQTEEPDLNLIMHLGSHRAHPTWVPAAPHFHPQLGVRDASPWACDLADTEVCS